MRLIAYPTSSMRPVIRPAPAMRQWLDDLPQAYGYRCLPLTIANAHGWEILCADGFEARWDGGRGKDAITISSDDPAHPSAMPTTHFGSGILTFHPGYLFRSEQGIDLWVQGPTNRPKDGIAALSGVIETDWAPYTFTMNWIFTRPGHTVRFETGEPFCVIYPMPRGLAESVEPEIRDLATDPETEATHGEWADSREIFNLELLLRNSKARGEKWQKDYYRGKNPDGSSSGAEHRTKLRLRPFDDHSSPVGRGKPMGGRSTTRRHATDESRRSVEDGTLTVQYAQRPEVAENEIENKVFLEIPDSDQTYHLNSTGAALWRLLAEPTTVETAVDVIHEAFPDVARNEIEADVASLVADLLLQGLLAESA